VSNFFPGKGQEHIINILDKLPNKEDYSYLQISSNIDFSIGKTLENKWNNQVMQCHNLDIRWLKNLSRQDTIGYFKNSNVFVFTSEKEVAPIVTLESMAARLPWVSTDTLEMFKDYREEFMYLLLKIADIIALLMAECMVCLQKIFKSCVIILI